MWKYSILFTLWVCVGLLNGCATESKQAETSQTETAAEKTMRMNHGVRNTPPERMLRSQTTARYRISYQPDPDPIPLNSHFRLKLNVQDLKTSRAPENPPELMADADMPEHNHGMHVKPVVTYLGNGQYEVKGLLFHMAGYWELKVDLKPETGDVETAIFGVELEVKPTEMDYSGH